MSEQEEITDEEAIMKIAQAMKDNTPTADEKHNTHSFLFNVVKEDDIKNVSRVGNLRDDKDLNELGVPRYNVRGAMEMARISDKIMNNEFFKDYFNDSAVETLISSLSREGFLIKQATTTTKQVADVTRRRRISKGLFGSKKIEEQGGDTTSSNSE